MYYLPIRCPQILECTSQIKASLDSDSYKPNTNRSPQITLEQKSRNQQALSISVSVSSVSLYRARISEIDTDEGQVSMNTQESDLANETSSQTQPAEQVEEHALRQRRFTAEVERDNSDENYDPDQDIEERRILRKGLRDLSKILVENRSEYMNANSNGLEDTITRANKISRQVKQTSDATIDSHLLVTAADITYKRTVAIVSGESSQCIDLDDLIHRCKVFMRHGDNDRGGRTLSTQENRLVRNNEEEESEDNEDETLNWEYLGRYACFQHLSRPCVPGFLLGPLATEKKAKRVFARKAAFKINSLKESRPEVLQEEDIVRDEDLNLSTMCQKITTLLEKVRADAMAAAELETRDDMTDQEAEALLDKHSLSREAGIALFKFVINPFSFGQTVENLFYVSFLIRDGKMAVTVDDRGMPYLELRDDGDDGNQGSGPSRHQAILAIDMADWKQLIHLFNIKEPIIRHREELEVLNMGARGWYA
ncbi:hypothetical protein Golomagni_01053 [Golovinomyces magnicellulatus]|nr:hypothetical protein Golomagni_01053 [Golovinomyces magnicellulatus]